MALEGLLALLAGGMSGYGQGRQDRWAATKPKTPPVVPETTELVADYDRNIQTILNRQQDPPLRYAKRWQQRYPMLPEKEPKGNARFF